MPTPEEVLSTALTQQANDQRRQVAQYANLEPRPGESEVPRRLMSDTGFLEATQFGYINAHRAHVIPPNDDDPRVIRQFVLQPYGFRLDQQRFRSSNRVIRSAREQATGVIEHPDNADVLVSAELSATTYSAQKNAVVRRNMTERHSGPAYHFLIDRNGGIAVGPALDFRTAVISARSEDSIFIGVEGALGILREDFTRRRYDRAFELPFTSSQVTTIAILLAKLYTAFPEVRKAFNNTAAPGILSTVYAPAPTLTPATRRNFVERGQEPTENLEFDYSATYDDNFFTAVLEEGVFDLATEIFRTQEAPRAVATRDAARVAIGRIDTAGAVAVALGAYTSVASPERATEMEAITRRALFITRTRAAHSSADQSGAQAGAVSTSTQSVAVVAPTVTNFEPHVYDYTTGRWGDGEVY
jgi:hypothetical protein